MKKSEQDCTIKSHCFGAIKTVNDGPHICTRLFGLCIKRTPNIPFLLQQNSQFFQKVVQDYTNKLQSASHKNQQHINEKLSSIEQDITGQYDDVAQHISGIQQDINELDKQITDLQKTMVDTATTNKAKWDKKVAELQKNIFDAATTNQGALDQRVAELQQNILDAATTNQGALDQKVAELQQNMFDTATTNKGALDQKVAELQKNMFDISTSHTGLLNQKIAELLASPTLGQLKYNPLFYQPIVVAHHQKIFPKYKNIHSGQSIVLCATGPTFNCFNKSMLPDAVYVGVNQAHLADNVDLDYLFVTDFEKGLRGKGDLITQKKSPKTKKFFGIMPIPDPDEPNTFMQFPVKFIDDNNAEYFFITESGVFPWDISYFPFTSWGSVVHPTMQFILYTHPSKIYLVGCDCGGGHFNSDIQIDDFAHKQLLDTWNKTKKAISTWYPDIEVISVNPVGLKGMFHDVYTESFLAQHPEINRNEVEILTEGDF